MVRSCVGQEDQKSIWSSQLREDTVIRAREVAKELSLLKSEKPVEREYTFGHFALKLLHRSRLQHQNGERSQGYIQALHSAVQNEDWGLLLVLW